MRIYDCRTNYQVNPLGISLENLVLTWKVTEAKGARAVFMKTEIAQDAAFESILWEECSEKEELCPPFFCHPDCELVPGEAYYWRVTIRDNAGDEATSEAASFEGGHPWYDRKENIREAGVGEQLSRDLGEEIARERSESTTINCHVPGWCGSFIKAPFVRDAVPVFVKEFTLADIPENLERARLYICGLGLYEVYLNGKKVGDDYLTPYCTDYRFWTQYQTYDIAPYLQAGENRMEVSMGEGWYMGKFGYANKSRLRDYFGDAFVLLADCYLDWKNGEQEIWGTDESFLALKSPVVTSGIYYGEMYDARAEKVLHSPAAFKLNAVKTAYPEKLGKLTPMVGLPVRKTQELPAVSLIRTKKGETVLDFGQIVTGWVAYWAEGTAGQQIILEYGEVLQDGCFYRDNLRSAEVIHTFFCSGEREFVRPHFTFFGFRYVRVTGYEVTEENLKDFTAWVIHSELTRTGHPETSNAEVNKLIANTVWSQRDNFLDIPTDCPQRDERLGWTGDAQIFSATASYHMLTAAFFTKYLTDMRYEQGEMNGCVPHVIPDVLNMGKAMLGEPCYDEKTEMWSNAGSSAWSDAAAVIPWNLYVFYGNKKLLAEQYPGMKAWADYVIRMDEKNCGDSRLWTCGFHFGDWLSLDSKSYEDRHGGTDMHYIASLYYMYSLRLVSKAAEVLGKKEEAAFYGTRSEEVRAKVREIYMTQPGTLSISTQTAYVMAIHLKLFEEPEMAVAAEHLKELLEGNGDKLLTGFVGTAFLCTALSQVGLDDKAYTLLLNTEYPGWLYEVRMGATTVWERWNSLLEDGSISGTGMNSLNHYAYGVVVEWIYRYACGIQPKEEAPGFAEILFTPRVDERLDFARAEYDSLAGKYKAGWRRENGKVVYELSVPFGCKAEFIPKERPQKLWVNGREQSIEETLRLTCGTYEIVAE